MKKWIAALLSVTLLICTGCSAGEPQGGGSTGPTVPEAEVITEEVKARLDAVLEEYQYEGIVYLTHNGKVVYQSVSGTNDLGEPLTIESPMYICSMSKQFCAAAILMLRDQGKLSLDDRLEQYFPEYTIGKDITLHNLLSMRSGIVRDVQPMLENPERYADDTQEEKTEAFLEYVFQQPLNFDPGTNYEYSNNNYRLLSFVVEMVSGQSYEDFIRQNIFQPLGMTHSGFLIEVPEHPEWGLTYDNIQATGEIHVLAKGSGGIVTTAADLDIWMNALKNGQVLSEKSYREMTTSHSSQQAVNYGFGLMRSFRDGWGHSGGNKGYTSRMYFSKESGYNLYIITGHTPPSRPNLTELTYNAFMRTVYEAVDAKKG